MSILMRGRSAIGLTALALLALAGGVGAQQQVGATLTNAADEVAAAKAKVLRAEAEALLNQPKEWRRVMELRLEAASVAPLEDPTRADDLWFAGSLAAAFEEFEEAVAHLQEAGDAAMVFGRLPMAAEAYALASVAAAQHGDWRATKDLLAKVELLAHSPLMPEEICDCLHARVAMLGENYAYLSTIRR